MSKQALQMKYHPAKKEVEFHRFQSGKEIPIKPESKLTKYENKRGRFVLQDHGNAFLKDITEAFDGESIIDIDVITTKIDYEDFEQMVEYFNNDSPIRIDVRLISELPDMEKTYRIVRAHGEKSVSILKKHQAKFLEIDMSNPDVKKVVEGFSADVQKEVDSIIKKNNAIAENNVNLCFAGVYSAGKSALINAILGYRILPEDIKSETARMFKIQSPESDELVRIVFSIRHSYAEIIWNNQNNIFEFGTAPTENNTRKIIQETLNSCKVEKQHLQIYEVLKTLNSNDEVNADIKIFFPIPLDNERVQFTIYDTPGTDSNYGEHQQILQDALSEQTHSILIFVAAPDKIEGEGNNALLTYLKEAEKKDSKTSIDIGRSLFVINKADTIDTDARKVLKTAKITDKTDDSFSIKLSDKKLFFVSAMYAYSAKAVVNNIATTDEQYRIEDDYNKIFRPERGRYYQQNHVATSEYATKIQINRNNNELSNNEQKSDRIGVFVVCSGLFALESEITNYGEKYAAAVRAFAIIDSVDKALSKMNTSAKALDKQNQQEIVKINQEIEDLRAAISDSIKEAYSIQSVPRNEALPSNILKELHLDKEYLFSSLVSEPKSFFAKLLKGWFFGLGKVKFDDKHKKSITQKITSVINDFSRNFLEKRQQLLENQRDSFIETVKSIIHSNGELSDAAKSFILEIRPPEVMKPKNLTDFGDIYDAHKRIDKVLWWDTEHIDKDKFIEDADRKLTNMATSMATDFEKDFRNSLVSILSAVEAEFVQNLVTYSALMKAKLEDKEAMEKLREKILAAAKELVACQKELNKLIWSVNCNE